MSFFKNLQRGTVKHSSGILTTVGTLGMFVSIGLTVTGTIKAVKIVEREKEELGVDNLTPKEVVKATWKCYVAPAVTAATSAACIIWSDVIATKKYGSLATGYKILETGFVNYKNKVIETFGEEKERVVREKVNEDKIKDNPASKTEVLITRRGDTLCFDSQSGRYFKSDMDNINRAVNKLNKTMLTHMYVSLNDYYDEIGLAPTQMGDELGWNLDDGLIDVEFSSHLADDGSPCLAVEYRIAPRYDFSKLM